jgi:putative transposase
MIQKAHKIRLKPNNKQANHFAKACGVSRFAYNWGLAEWKKQYNAGGKPRAYDLVKRFNSIKRTKYPFVTEVTKCSPERAIKNLDSAFRNLFQSMRAGRKPEFPRFKRKGIKDSFYIASDLFRFNGKRVRIPKLGWVKMRESLRFKGKVMSATVSRTAGKWFISVHVEIETQAPIAIGPTIGVDVGLKKLAVTSDGEVFDNPKALKRAEKRMRLLNKAVSRKKKDSNNRKKAAMKLARQHYRVSCIRKDAIHKATTAITKGCSAIGIEDLNVKGMLKNHKLAKALSDASIAEFLRQIECKAKWRGVIVVKADRFFPSSKTCSACSCVKWTFKLKTRIYHCNYCGFEADRDLNAAINLKNLAVGSTVSACRLGSAGHADGGVVKLPTGQEFLTNSTRER